MVDIASFRVGIFPSESSKFSPWLSSGCEFFLEGSKFSKILNVDIILGLNGDVYNGDFDFQGHNSLNFYPPEHISLSRPFHFIF